MEEDADLAELSHAQHVITVPDFAPELCQQLRQVRHLVLLSLAARRLTPDNLQEAACSTPNVCLPAVAQQLNPSAGGGAQRPAGCC